MADKLSEAQLEAIIANQIELAKTHDSAERATDRDKAINYFLGDMDKYVPPEENRSKVVSRDLADTVATTLPQVERVFLSTDRFAVVEPTATGEEEFADQATIGLNHVFFKDNDGEGLIYDGTWDALVHANAIVKTFYDDTPVYATSFHSDLSDDQIAQLLAPDDDGESPEVLAHTKHMETVPDPETGQPTQMPFHDIKIKRKKEPGTFVIEIIPPEEFLIDADAVTTSEAAFTAHSQRKTRSSLIAMGYSKDEVWAIPAAARVATPEAVSRSPGGNTSESTDKSMELVDYHECYIRVDVDGDGEAELVRACYGGPGGTAKGALLDWEVWEDEHPFDDIKCDPMPHRWLARSQTDNVVDIQDVKTVLKRQLLNNTYWVNNPQRFVAGKIKNPDQLDNPTFGGTVYGDQGTLVTELPVPYIGDKTLLAIQHMDEELLRRTGIMSQGEAVDPDELQTQTAAAVHDKKDARHVRVEQYARNMARGWRSVMRKLLRLMIQHQDYARKIMSNGKEVVIDPRFWNADMGVSINVGLGTGSRDRDLQMLGQVLNSQLMLADRFIASGAMEDAIDMLPKIIQTMTKMAESAGIRNPEDFYPDYTEEKVAKLKEMAAQPKPDPALALEEAKGKNAIAVAQANGQTTLQVEQGKNELAAQQAEVQAQGDVVKNQAELEADLQTAAADREKEIALEQMRQQGENAKIASQERMKSAELENERLIKAAEFEHQAMLEDKRLANAARIAASKPEPAPAGKTN